MFQEKKKFLPLLRVLQKMNSKDIGDVVPHLDDCSIDTICECVYNVIHTDMNLSKKKRRRWMPHWILRPLKKF